jgi:hypothetical protein
VKSVSVRYRNCDPAINRSNSFISLLVSEATGRPVEVVSDARALVDVQFTSVQVPLVRRLAVEGRRLTATRLPGRNSGRDTRWRRENPEPKGNARAHIWFTGENVRPPAGPWDGYLSFDTDPLNGSNAYLPLWWYSVGILGTPSSIFTSVMPSWDQLLRSRDPGKPRPKFACAFINNPEPMRLHAIRALESVGQVDVFGGAVGRPVPDKAAIAQDYRFVVCFENDVYPGYVTEKPFEAWTTGAIPLWRGTDPEGYINPKALVNAAALSNLEEFVSVVSHLDASPSDWRFTASQPILSRPPDLRAALDVIRRGLGLA